MAQTVEKHMQTIFKKVQYNKTDHPSWIKKLTKLYERVSCFMFLLNNLIFKRELTSLNLLHMIYNYFTNFLLLYKLIVLIICDNLKHFFSCICNYV